MERPSVDWQTQYCENGHATKSNLRVLCNPYQNSNDILQRYKKISLEIYIQSQKISLFTIHKRSQIVKPNRTSRQKPMHL
jgi:hypothetical protein